MAENKKPNFENICINLNTSLSLYDLKYSGVIGVFCKNTNKFLIFYTDEILTELDIFFDKIEQGEIQNSQILLDYQKYGKNSFVFSIFAANIEFENFFKCEKTLEYFLTLYSDQLY